MAENDLDGGQGLVSPQRMLMNREIMFLSAASLSLVMLLFISVYIYVRCVVITRQSRRRRTQRLILTLQLRHTDTDPPTFGLDRALIAALPVFNVKSGGGGVNNATECVVCLSALEDEEMAKLLPNCKHSFHVGCIDRWLASHSTCPLCRAMVQPRLEPQLREGPTTLPLELDAAAAHLVLDLEPSQSRSEGPSNESSAKIDCSSSTSRLSSFRRVL